MKRITIGTLALGALLVTAPAATAKTMPENTCASGYEFWDVKTRPYQADNDVDEAGNDDGWVCARALGEGLSKQYGTDATIYHFVDN